MELNLLAERLSEVLAAKFGNPATGLKQCGLAKNVISNIKRGSFPSVDKVAVIAENTDTSMDYLLGREKKAPVTGLSEREEQLIEHYRAVSLESQLLISQTAEHVYLLSRTDEQYLSPEDRLFGYTQDSLQENRA